MKYMTLLLLIIPWSIRTQNNVGIGTTAPVSKLHVVANSTLTYPQLRLTETNEDFARFKMENSLHPGAYWDIAGKPDTITGSSKLNFYFKNNLNSGDRLTITGMGNVGIGITAPAAQLDILGGDYDLDAGNPGDLRIGNGTYNMRIGVGTSGANAGIVRMYSQGGGLFLGTNNTPHLTITTLGNVGIGTPTPLNRLRIVGNVTTAPVVSVHNSYSGSSDVRAIEAFSTPGAGYGIGGYFVGGYKGIQVTGQGTTFTGTTIALEASATGSTAGTRTGILGRATGGTINWAGYFDQGHVYVTNELRIGSEAQSGVPGYKVAIDGKIIAEELRVQLSADWPDYVFNPEYELMPLSDLERAIRRDHHLPGIPNATEVAENGILVGDMQARMMEKIEELTLYIIDLEKQNKDMNQRIARLESNPKYDPK